MPRFFFSFNFSMSSRESKHPSLGGHACVPSALTSRSSPQPLWCDHILERKMEREMFLILGMLCSAFCSYSRMSLEVGITPWSVQWLCMCYTHRHVKAWNYMGLSTPYCGLGPCLCEPGVQRLSSDSFCCTNVFMRGCSFYLWSVLTEKPCLLYPSHQGEKRIKSLKSGLFSLNVIE